MICNTGVAAATLCSVVFFLLLGPAAVVLGQSATTIDATVSQSAGTLWLTTGTFSKLTIVNVGSINVVVRDVTVTSGGITVTGVGSTACTLLFSRVTSTSTTNDANAGALVFTEPVRCHKFQIIGSTFSMHAPSQPWRAGVMLGGGVFSSTLFEITDSTITGRGRSGTGAVRSPGAIQGIAHFKILRSTFLGRNDYGGDHGNALFFTAGVKSVTLWSVIDSVLEGQNHLGRVASAIYLDHGVHDVQAIRFQGTTLRSKAQRVSMNFYIWAPYPTSRGIRNVDSVQFIDCLFDSEGLQSSASAVAWIGGQDNFRSFVFERSPFDIRTPSGTVCLSLHASIPDGHTMDIDELVFKDSTMKTTTPGSGTAMTFSGVNAIKNVRIENTTAEMAMGSHTSFMQFGHAVTLANSKYAITGSTIRMTGATALNVAAVRFLAAVTAPNFNLNVSDTTIVIDAQGPRCSAILFTVGSTGTNGDLAFHNTDITVKGANSPGKKEIAVLVTNGTAADFNSVVISGGRWVSSGYDYVFGTRFMAGLRSTSRFVVEDVEISATTLGSGFAYTLFAERFHLVNYIQIRRSRISSKSATTHALAVHVQQGVISGTTFSIEDSVIEATSNVVAAAVYLDGGLKHWTNVLVHNTTLRSRSVQENARGFFYPFKPSAFSSSRRPGDSMLFQ